MIPYVKRAYETMIEVPSFGLEGEVGWEVVDNEGNVRKKGGHKNLLLNSGLNSVASASRNYTQGNVIFQANSWVTNNLLGLVDTVHVGEGTATPDVTQNSLAAEVASTGDIINISSSNTLGLESSTITYQFPLGVINSNLKEVGFSSGNANNLFSRSLFQQDGLPVTVTVTPDEQLRVSYTLRSSWPTGRFPFTMNITGLGSFDGEVGVFGYNNSSLTGLNFLALTDNDKVIGAVSSSVMPASPLAGVVADTSNMIPLTSEPGKVDTQDISNRTFTREDTISYISNTFYRDVKFRYTAIQIASQTCRGFFIKNGSTQQNSTPVLFRFDIADSFVKDDLNILDLFFRYRWGRGV